MLYPRSSHTVKIHHWARVCVLIFKGHESLLLTSSAVLWSCVCVAACKCTHTFANTHLWEGVAGTWCFFFFPFFKCLSLHGYFFSLCLLLSRPCSLSTTRQRWSPACTTCLLRGDLSAVNAKCTTYTGALCCFVFMSIPLRVDKLITLGVCEFVYLCTEGFWVIWCLWSPNGVWSVCLCAPRLLFIA